MPSQSFSALSVPHTDRVYCHAEAAAARSLRGYIAPRRLAEDGVAKSCALCSGDNGLQILVLSHTMYFYFRLYVL